MNGDQVAQFLLQASTSPEFAGVVLWLVVGAIFKAWTSASNDAKFWTAFVLSLVIPPAAVLLRSLTGLEHPDTLRYLYAVGIGFTVSQTVHRTTTGVQKALSTEGIS